MKKILQLFSLAGFDWFIPALLLMVCLAYAFPGPGVATEPVSLESIASYGVTGIFFFYGLKLNWSSIKKGLSNWQMHLLIQLSTFLLFPLLTVLIYPIVNSAEQKQLWLGLFFLAALPSTVSSSVVMVSIAGGNIPAAIFNASISAFIGVFITPLWMGAVLQQSGTGFAFSDIVFKLVWQVLIPVIIGLALHKTFGGWTERYKHMLKTFDQMVILMIVYISFSHSFYEQVFDKMTFSQILLLSSGLFVLFVLVLFLMQTVTRVLKFNRQDRITVLFCGSKKSLVHGTVMAGILFEGSSLAGFLLLPVMLYHAIQLLAASALAKRMALSSTL